MNRGSVSRAVSACDLGGIRQNWPNRYAVTVTTALFLALAMAVLISLSGTAAADTRNLTSTADGGLSELSPNANSGSASTLKVDGDDPDPGGGDLYAALRWDLSQVPAGATVNSATVTLNITNASPQTYAAYELKRSWSEGQLTWNQAATGTPWATAGAKGTADRGSQIASLTPTNIAPYTFTIPASVVQGWLNTPSTNNGILLAHTTNYDGFVFDTREGNTPPKLTLNYTTSGGGGADTTPPDTTIDSGPSGTVSSASASFDFSTNEAGSTFECSLDGASFASCTSPKSYAGLSDGPHTFQVRAKDAAGNVDGTPATRTWTVNTASPPPPTSRYLSDMNWNSMTNGWGPAEKDMSNGEQASGDGRTITLNGATFQKGLGVHGASDVRYDLAGAYSTFSAKVGVDDEVGDQGSVVFEVWADGTMLYSSGVMNGASTTKDVRVDIRGKNELRLVVTNASDGANFDHADWAGALVDNSTPPPSADSDGDGVTDDVDKCVNEKGPASNNGCPVVDSGTDPPNVCAHWHVAAQREVSGVDTVAELMPEFQKASDMGVECFALNVNGWDSNYQFNTNLVWKTANQWNADHPSQKIYLYPSIDMASISSEATFEAISRYNYNDPARLKVDGGVKGDNLPVTQTWQGQNHFGGPSGWQRILNEEAGAGFPIFFMPMFDPANAGMTIAGMVDAYNGANNSSQSDDIVDGFYNFGGLASGDNSERGYQKNQEWNNAIQASPGMDFQAGCAPHFNRHSDSGQFGNRIIGDFEGFHAFNKCMYGFAKEQKPRFMEFTTWNDYLEGSYLGGPYTQAQLPSRYDGNYLSHDAFRKLGRYYIDWYESGAQPTINKDFIAIAHRPHPENAPGINVNGTGIADDTDSIGLVRQTDYSVVEDRLYAIVLLTQPGQVRLTSGTASQTFDVGAGITEVSMPFAAGIQRIELVRNGATQLSATSPIQITPGPVALFNYNVATTYAEGP